MQISILLTVILLLVSPVVAQQEKRVAVILVNFQDKQEQPYTPAFVQGVMAGVDDVHRENSYNQIFLTTDVWGWYTIASSYTTCDLLTIASQAKAAAQAGGANLSNYQHFSYMFPANGCTFFAAATYGPPFPTDMWIKGQPNVKQVSHEFGHNLGLRHSRSYNCGPEPMCSNGIYDEYGDHFDLMGDGEITQHFNLYQKEGLGWVGVTNVIAFGDYAIGNLEAVGEGLKIQRGTSGQFYYLEKRSAINGALIHFAPDSLGGLNPSLLDMTTPYDGFQPALTAGRSFVDVDFDIGVYVVSAGPTGAVVRVTCAACVPPPDTQAPTVVITSPSGTVPRNTTIAVTANASDNVGVDHVDITVTATNYFFSCTDATAPYSCQWAVPGKKNAVYTITARAYDVAGNLGTHSVVVTAN